MLLYISCPSLPQLTPILSISIIFPIFCEKGLSLHHTMHFYIIQQCCKRLYQNKVYTFFLQEYFILPKSYSWYVNKNFCYSKVFAYFCKIWISTLTFRHTHKLNSNLKVKVEQRPICSWFYLPHMVCNDSKLGKVGVYYRVRITCDKKRKHI